MKDQTNALVVAARKQMDPDETIEAMVGGQHVTELARWNGVLIATDRRLLFHAKTMMRTYTESFPYAQLSSFEVLKKAFSRSIQFTAASSKVTVHRINDDDLDTLQQIVRQKMHDAHQPAPAARPVEASAEPADRLRRLEELHQQGLLDDSEYKAKRASILDSL